MRSSVKAPEGADCPPDPGPALSMSMRFDEASRAVVSYLQSAIPMGGWAVTRVGNDQQLLLSVEDISYGLSAGDTFPWSITMCQYMVDGAPQIAPDTATVPEYSSAPMADVVAAYVGLPICDSSGALFGTLCGFNLTPKDDGLYEHRALLQLLAALLGSILDLDQQQTATERALERAQLDAETDALTGLLNRRGWERILATEEDRYRRFGDSGSLIVIDLDRLKTVNDTLGHGAGDEHLRRTAHTLRTVVRPSDAVARLGGDEFGVMAGDVTPQETASLVGRLQAALDTAGVSGSIGHAPYTVVAGFPGAWQSADEAMYVQKAERRVKHARSIQS